MHELLTGLTALTALGCGVVAGVFFAFSTFVMRALGNLSARDGITAMQTINVAALPSVFFFTGLATAIGSFALVGWALVEWHESFAPYLAAGGLVYLIGSMGVTVAFNLPLNDSLAEIDPQEPAASHRWSRYLKVWTFWNHVRGAAAFAASAALVAVVLLV